jgi:hypothetical protein
MAAKLVFLTAWKLSSKINEKLLLVTLYYYFYWWLPEKKTDGRIKCSVCPLPRVAAI